MKVDLKARVVKAAMEQLPNDGFVVLAGSPPKVVASPDAFWVQAWVKIPFGAVQNDKADDETAGYAPGPKKPSWLPRIANPT